VLFPQRRGLGGGWPGKISYQSSRLFLVNAGGGRTVAVPPAESSVLTVRGLFNPLTNDGNRKDRIPGRREYGQGFG